MDAKYEVLPTVDAADVQADDGVKKEQETISPVMTTACSVVHPSRSYDIYPGNRRSILPPPMFMEKPDNKDNNQQHDDGDMVLIKTAGNALQAVSRSIVSQPNVIAVHVPPYVQEGDVIHVRLPMDKNQDSKLIEVTVPSGCHPGHVFFVTPPPLPTNPTTVVGVPVEGSFVNQSSNTIAHFKSVEVLSSPMTTATPVESNTITTTTTKDHPTDNNDLELQATERREDADTKNTTTAA